ncbi:MAG TPA: IS110 family transposase [Candidatus Sulfotelmatobacter sp.]|jgi:transposase|nr:IS110 family transposase [Candidatus Sulfotelmatobacter sp.]
MKKCTLFIGLDDSKDTIEVAVAEGVPGGEVRDFGSVPNTPESLAKLVRRLGRPKDLFFAYEAGPCGYGTYRTLLGLGASCLVAAPSKTPRRPGERIKNDRRDARTLAKLHRASELTPIWVPDAPTEAMRDLTRAREDAKYAQTRARQRLFAFLLRHGRRYPGRTTWSAPHFRWLRTQSFDHPAQQICMEEYLLAIEEATNRVARLDQQIEQLVPQWTMRPVVRALTAHRGVNLLAASTLIAELGDLTRFDKPRTLMAFVGLVPSLTASGLERRTGRITKTGNAHARRCLIESAWAFRHPARRSNHLQRRLEGQPQDVQDLAWKAQVRLCGRYRRLTARGKQHNKVICAVARELVAFLWATARTVAVPA